MDAGISTAPESPEPSKADASISVRVDGRYTDVSPLAFAKLALPTDVMPSSIMTFRISLILSYHGESLAICQSDIKPLP